MLEARYIEEGSAQIKVMVKKLQDEPGCAKADLADMGMTIKNYYFLWGAGRL